MNLKFSNLGWVVAAGLGGIMVAGGFQTPTQKIANADLDQIVQKSDFWKTSELAFNDYGQRRRDIFQYIDRNGVMEQDQFTQLVDLATKENPTAQDKAALDKVKSDVSAEEKNREDLAVKTTALTDDEKAKLRHYQQRADANTQGLQQLDNQFNNEIKVRHDSIMSDAVDRAKKAIQSVGKAQGYTIIYSAAAAPYCSNDITADAITAMNAQK